MLLRSYLSITVSVAALAIFSALFLYASAAVKSVDKINEYFTDFLEYKQNNFQKLKVDANGDDELEDYILTNGILEVRQNNRIIWKSPDNWWIDSLVIADSTHNGQLNLNLSLWKSGNYGFSMPFWETENDPSVKNHFFVYEYKDGQLKQVWGSSNLSKPNCEISFKDIDNDGQQELLVIEGEYTNDYSCQGNYLAVWKWQSWGFYNEWRSEQGLYEGINNYQDLYGKWKN